MLGNGDVIHVTLVIRNNCRDESVIYVFIVHEAETKWMTINVSPRSKMLNVEKIGD